MSCDTQILARRAEHHYVDLPQRGDVGFCNFGHVTEVRDIRIVVGQYGARERLNLRYGNALPAKRVPRNGRSLNPAEQRQVPQGNPFRKCKIAV